MEAKETPIHSNSEASVSIDLRPELPILDMPASVAFVDGKPTLVPIAISKWMAVLSRNAEKKLTVRIYKRRSKRSNPQNAYLWAVVYPDLYEGLREQCVESGLAVPFASVDDLHEWAKWKWLKATIVLPGGEEDVYVRSSAQLSMEAFSEYVSQIMAFAAERGIYIRSAGE